MPAPFISAPPGLHIVIGVGDLAVSDSREAVLSTYALGSCVGIVAYDSHFGVGGILHIMLPDSAIARAKAAVQPAMFADTGLPQLFRQLTGLNGPLPHLQLLLAGGANVLKGRDPFRIGELNAHATLNYFKHHGYVARHQHLGDTVNRTLHLEMATGLVTIKRPDSVEQFSLA
jgi:chemotaxis protein CheD